jgi:hypothetical protein
VAHNQELAERRKQALHIVSESNPEEVAVPIVVHTEAVEAVHMEVVRTEAVEAVHMEVEVDHTEAAGAVQAVHMEVEVDHTEVAGAVQAVHMEVAVPNLVGLDHKTWIIPSCRVIVLPNCTIQGNGQYHTTGVEANRQVIIREVNHENRVVVHNTKNVLYVIVLVNYVWSYYFN